MPDLPWLRLYTDTVDNEKLRLLAFEDRWHYIAILCLKQQGIINQNNQLMVRQIAVKLGLQLNDLDETKKRLMDVKLIDENYEPIGWKKHQYKSDSSTARVRKYRKSKKKLENKSNGNETLQKRTKTLPKQKSNALDTDTDTDTDTDIKDLSKSKDLDFSDFWKNYPRKEAKKKAELIWNRLSNSKRKKALKDLETRFQGIDPKFIPLPTTYLNGERFNDELSTLGDVTTTWGAGE